MKFWKFLKTRPAAHFMDQDFNLTMMVICIAQLHEEVVLSQYGSTSRQARCRKQHVNRTTQQYLTWDCWLKSLPCSQC